MPDIDTLFLDAGNTLITMDHALLCEILGSHGIACTPEALARAEAAARPAVSRFLAGEFGSEARETFVFYLDRILTALGAPADDDRRALLPRLAVAVRDIGTRRLWSKVLPGVPDALATLRAAGLTLVVVSNSDGTVEEGLIETNLRPQLDVVVDSALVGFEKPDPRIFQHALALVGARPNRTLHVGDLYSVDVLGARAAGLHALLLDPYGDWPDAECLRVPDLAGVVRHLLATR